MTAARRVHEWAERSLCIVVARADAHLALHMLMIDRTIWSEKTSCLGEKERQAGK